MTSGPAEAGDRAGAGRDSAGAERDGVAAHRDRVADQRDRAGDERDADLRRRDRSGETRDGASDDRDQAALERDRAGALRDLAAEERDRAAEHSEARHRFRLPKGLRRSALARLEAAADRAGASDDRRAGAGERTGAELDRDAARGDRLAGARQRSTAGADRDASARDRHDASIDTLTGVSCRGAGFLALDRDIARARRCGEPLLVGFVDVDHLKAVNDGQGHAAGDQMLQSVADALRTSLRASDLVFRYGGDEFVCVLFGVDAPFGDSRISLVNGALGVAAVPASVTAGFAELRAGESSVDLVARADAALYRKRDGVGPQQPDAPMAPPHQPIG